MAPDESAGRSSDEAIDMDEISKPDEASASRDRMAQNEAIVRLFAQHQRWLFGYLTALLGNAAEAEDVFQEVCVVMWREHEAFEMGTNFTSWLSVIAYHQVQKYWRIRKKSKRVLADFNVERLAAELPENLEILEARRRALPLCISKLRETDQELIQRCYGDRKVSARQVAREVGRPENTVYKALNRIRKALHRCIDSSIAAGGTNEVPTTAGQS